MTAARPTFCGRIGRRWPVITIAERAAQAIAGAGECQPHAVCLDDDGSVTVYRDTSIWDATLLGVYEWSPGVTSQVQLWKQIEEDLVWACRKRSIPLRPSRRAA